MRFGGLLVALLLALSGCGGSYYNYYKPGVSLQQMRQDSFECKQISREQFIVGTGGMLVGGSEPNFQVWKECLEARGYTVNKADEEEERVRQREAQWLQDEYKWILAERDAINDSAARLNRDPIDSPERRHAFDVHAQRLEEYNRRVSAYEQRGAAFSTVTK